MVGRSLGGRYDVLELLGAGGMGAVYRVLDRELDEVVALKVIRSELADRPAVAEQFRTEVRLARRVTHRNVARTFELGRADDVLYCTMELVDGESVAAMLARRGRLPADEAVAIACAVCDGLAAAHEASVIHRDVKPDNVLVDPHGRVVLTDFGVASVIVGHRGASGTPPYMAPEQLRGEPPTPAADVYSVGVLLYEMLTGVRAFPGSVTEIVDAKQVVERLVPGGVAPALADAVARATAREPADRFATAAELRHAIAPFAGPGIHAGRAARDASDVRVVAVRAPRGDGDTLYIAQAVHAELMERLQRIPRLRVEVTGDAPVVVELVAGRSLDLIVHARESLSIPLPLAVAHVRLAADTAAAAVAAALDPPASTEAHDLLLRARALAQTDVSRWAAAIELAERAAALDPGDARIAAALALAHVQRAFFATVTDRRALDRAGELVRFALGAAPELHDTQLAAGQLELHTGEPVRAAARFRVAIACAPHAAGAHEQLGRMLLEAGHLDEGMARLREALVRSPQQTSARWEIARARALEQDWAEHDRLIAELGAAGRDTALGELRFVCWRGDPAAARALRTRVAAEAIWEPELFDGMFAVICDGAWASRRDHLIAVAHAPRASRRRNAVVAQLVAEAACFAGDARVAEAMLALALDHGLFDRHWLERCPTLDVVRGRPTFGAVHAEVASRARAIRDALYGDHSMATAVDGET